MVTDPMTRRNLPVPQLAAFAGTLGEATDGTRTRDPFITSEVLYQLSYGGLTGSDGSR